MANHRSSDAGLLETLADEDETLRAGNRKSSGNSSNEWLVNIADDVVVPMLTNEVVEALRVGRLSNRSLVWRIGMHDWTSLADVPQLGLAAGPSALPPPPASTPGPVVRKSLSPPEKPRRRVPSGVTPVTKPKDDSGALAVYNRPAPSLTFADSVRAEWRGKAQPLPPPAPPAPLAPPSRPRLTPVPPVASRLPPRVLRVVPTNTLSPTTAETAQAAPLRPPTNPWGDLSVVLASELRAEKKATKRLMLWAALGSALAASLFTFWVSRSVTSPGSAARAEATVSQASAPQGAATLELASPRPLLSATLSPPAVASAIAVKPAATSIAAKPRALAKPKPKLLAPVLDSDGTSAAVSAEKPSTATASPVAAPEATAPATPPTSALPTSVAPSGSAAAPSPVEPPSSVAPSSSAAAPSPVTPAPATPAPAAQHAAPGSPAVAPSDL